jgi:hypothetical protein
VSEDGRFVIAADPVACPSLAHVFEPFWLTQSPCRATPAITTSASCLADMNDKLPHSDFNPARFDVA